MVDGMRKQEFHPMESCRYGSSARQCVVLNFCLDNAVHARGGGDVCDDKLGSCGLPRHHMGFAAGRRRVYQQQTCPGESLEMVGRGWTPVPCEMTVWLWTWSRVPQSLPAVDARLLCES